MEIDNRLSASRIALELDRLPGDQAWYLITTPQPETAAAELVEALGARGVGLERRVPHGPDALLTPPPHPTTGIVTGTDAWDDEAWKHLDRLRTSVLAVWPRLIWIIKPETAGRLLHRAPNFSAFFLPEAGARADGPVVEEVSRYATLPFFEGGLPAAPLPPPPGSYAAQAAARPEGTWLLFENDQLVDSADRLVELRRWPRVEGRTYSVIARDALP